MGTIRDGVCAEDDGDRRSQHSPLDLAIAELAGRQHGLVTSAQLRELGLGARGELHRAAAGRLHRCFAGVYTVGHPVLTVQGRRLAAVLACGEGAVLSHASAASAWGLLAGDGARWDVTTPGSRSRAPTSVRLHRTRRLPASHVTVRDGVPITTVARTVVDLAETGSRGRVARAMHEAEVLRLLDVAVIADVLAALPGRRGGAVVQQMLDEASPVTPDRSELEHRYRDLVASHDLPQPRFNVHLDVGGRLMEVDVLWPEHRVIVELDGEHVHGTSHAFHADRARDAALAARGYVVIRLTWRRISREPEAVAEELRQILRRRPPA